MQMIAVKSFIQYEKSIFLLNTVIIYYIRTFTSDRFI